MVSDALRDVNKGLSSKRIVVILAFVAMVAFTAKLVFEGKIDNSDKAIFDSLKWIVMAGLFAVTSERFLKAVAVRLPALQNPEPPAQDAQPSAPAPPDPGAEQRQKKMLSTDDGMLDIKRLVMVSSVIAVVSIMFLKMFNVTISPQADVFDFILFDGFTYIVIAGLASVSSEKLG